MGLSIQPSQLNFRKEPETEKLQVKAMQKKLAKDASNLDTGSFIQTEANYNKEMVYL